MKEMPTAYEPKKYEDDIYKRWEASGFFNPDNLEGEPYSIMMPPPNVTGVLHLGHALENSLMDIMIRFQRMRGKKALLLPGTDHAAVATQAKVEKLLVEGKLEGYPKVERPREEFGREKLVEIIRDFAEDSKATILSQIRKIGTSCDWSRLAYTFDEQRSRVVNEVFKKMYEDGLIYRGKRMVNWSVGAHSVLSDDELEWVDLKEPFYYIRCGDFVIGTVRPETKCADSPLVVHPEGEYVELQFKNSFGSDDKLIVSKNLYENKDLFNEVLNTLQTKSDFAAVKIYKGKELEGREFEYDTYAAKRKFYVIADNIIDINKGTGAMTISSSHSADDYDLAKRRNLNETFIQKIDFDGKMTDLAGPVSGLSILEARKKAVQLMKEQGLIVGIDNNYAHNVPLCYRSKTVVEPMISRQWFVAVDKEIPGRGKTLKQLVQEAVDIGHKGDADQKINLIPEGQLRRHRQRIENLHDWCISRQIWWGHRIPVWYCYPCHDDPQKFEKGEYWMLGEEKPEICPRCGADKMHQDEDTLDTWFSSGTWTFSTLGWPDKTSDLDIYHPTSWMQMGHEILFLWFQRMVMMSVYTLDEIPFRDVYIHGLLRNEQGKKFSKSDGNTMDPLIVTEKYSADALRYSIIAGVTPGNDSRFYLDKVESARNLVNKFWNVARFIMTNTVARARRGEPDSEHREFPKAKTLADKWILSRLDQVVYETTKHIENYYFSQAAELLRDFTWNELADWYLEIVKIEGEKSDILDYVLNTLLKLWHPFTPFVTEAIWKELGHDGLLMVAKWPCVIEEETAFQAGVTSASLLSFGVLQNVVAGIRAVRADYHIEPAKKVRAVIHAKDTALFEENAEVVKGLARLSELSFGEKPKTSAGFVAGGVEVFVDLEGAVDIEKEKARIEKEIASVEPYAASLEKKLKNKGFADNAPSDVITQEKEKLADAQAKLEKLKGQLLGIS